MIRYCKCHSLMFLHSSCACPERSMWIYAARLIEIFHVVFPHLPTYPCFLSSRSSSWSHTDPLWYKLNGLVFAYHKSGSKDVRPAKYPCCFLIADCLMVLINLSESSQLGQQASLRFQMNLKLSRNPPDIRSRHTVPLLLHLGTTMLRSSRPTMLGGPESAHFSTTGTTL